MNNRARRERQARRWARYFNHYAPIANAKVGGRAASLIVWDGLFGHSYARPFKYVRRQGKY